MVGKIIMKEKEILRNTKKSSGIKKGSKIRINFDGNEYEVVIVKILEWVKRGVAGFVEVKFLNGVVKTLAIFKGETNV